MYYIYAYLRQDGRPYYIGKGKDDRAFKSHGSVRLPKNKNLIVVMETNLTEVGALALERRYIRWYGKKSDGSGILINKTDGGDGIAGWKHSSETKEKISRIHKNNHQLGVYKTRKGQKNNTEHRDRISASKLGKPNPAKRKCYEIMHPDGKIESVIGIVSWCKERGLSPGNMVSVAKGRLTHYKQYKVLG